MSRSSLRLDQLLVKRKLVRSRSHAIDAVRRGMVRVAGQLARKPSQRVGADVPLDIDKAFRNAVSRAGEKLAYALKYFSVNPAGKTCLDIGASTGGFTQVLLKGGAKRVYAVDVGTGQLDALIKANPRVVALEQFDARNLDREAVSSLIELIVADVSFISLTKVLAAALALASPQATILALVKPQFELGPDVVGKDGVVHDYDLRTAAMLSVCDWLEKNGWRVAGHIQSPILGKNGNIEWLVSAGKK